MSVSETHVFNLWLYEQLQLAIHLISLMLLLCTKMSIHIPLTFNVYTCILTKKSYDTF